MAKAKGTTLIPRLKYMDVKGTPAQKEAVLALLRPEFQAEIRKGILQAGWYPLDLLVDLSLAIDKVMGKNDLALIRELARFASEEVLNTVYKMFFRVGSPEFIVSSSANLWTRFYNSGTLKFDFNKAEKRVTFQVIDFDQPSHVHCLTIMAWMEKTLELCGLKLRGAQCVQCREKQAAHCEYLFRWE